MVKIFNSLSSLKITCLCLTLFLLSYSSYGQEQLFNEINRGVHDVGFKTFWKTDYSRSFIHKKDTIARPLLINIWYPAKTSAGQNKMQNKEYFDLESVKYEDLINEY